MSAMLRTASTLDLDLNFSFQLSYTSSLKPIPSCLLSTRPACTRRSKILGIDFVSKESDAREGVIHISQAAPTAHPTGSEFWANWSFGRAEQAIPLCALKLIAAYTSHMLHTGRPS
jgi:hypothetical protein